MRSAIRGCGTREQATIKLTRSMKRAAVTTAAAGAAMALLLSACASSTAGTSTSSSAGDGSAIVVPMITDLSGTYAQTGQEEKQAAELLAKVVNSHGGVDGHQLQFRFYNDQGEASVAVPLASKVISSGAKAIFLGPTVGQIQPMVNLATASGPLMLAMSPGIVPAPGSYTFAPGQTPTSFAQQITFKYLLSKGITRVAVVYGDDPSGQQGLQEITSYANNPEFKGKIHLVTIQSFQDTAVSAVPQMDVVKAAKPQALILWSSGPPSAIAFKALQEVGLTNIPVISTSANEDPPYLTGSVASVLPKDLEFASALYYTGTAGLTSAEAKPIDELQAAYKDAGAAPTQGTALVWDLGLNLVAAYKKAGGINASAQQLLKAMESLSNVRGTDATFYNYSTTDHIGTTASEYRMAQWDAATKTFVAISPLGG